jgi:hypothetical protein
MSTRTFIAVLSTDSDGAVHRLRRALKTLWRRDGLRCVSLEEKSEPQACPPEPNQMLF